MRPEELMIGDLVTFKECQYGNKPTIIKIVQINANGNALVSIDGDVALDEIHIDDEIVGIPLTPEILKKNGFWLDYKSNRTDPTDKYIYYLSHDICETIDIHSIWIVIHRTNKESNNWRMLFTLTSFTCDIETRTPDCSIHQLQHLLRLCKINKEIVP